MDRPHFKHKHSSMLGKLSLALAVGPGEGEGGGPVEAGEGGGGEVQWRPGKAKDKEEVNNGGCALLNLSLPSLTERQRVECESYLSSKPPKFLLGPRLLSGGGSKSDLIGGCNKCCYLAEHIRH